MKTYVTVSFNEGRARYKQVRQLLESIDCAEDLEGLDTPFPGLYGHTFDTNDPKLEELRFALRTAGVTWNEFVDCVYNDAELKEFPLLLFGLRRPLIEGGGARFGTEYDVSKGCPHCGTGAVQTSLLMVPTGGFPRRSLICETYSGAVLVAKELADAFRKARLSGLELRQVCSRRGKQPQPWWQMISTYTMPRAAKGMDRDVSPGWGCTVCERDLWVPEDLRQITYARSEVDPAALPDVVFTWECYGRSIPRDDPERDLVQGFAQPFLLVSQKMFDIFRKLKVKQAEFSPVRIE